MVNYSYIVCVPYSTPENDPYREEIELRHDTILNILILIPPGHMGATGVRIKYGPKQIMPVEPSTWIKGDNIVVSSTGPIRLPEAPIKLTVEAYNNSSSYDHCFYIYIDAINWRDYAFGGKLDHLIETIEKLEEIMRTGFTNMGVYPPVKRKERPRREIKRLEPESIIERIKKLLGR